MKAFWIKESEKTDIVPRSNPELLGKIKGGIAIERRKRTYRKLKIYRLGLSAAAVLIIALLLGNVFLYRLKQPEIAEQTITTPNGAKTSYTLPDGSSVWLNSGTTISFPVKFGEKREVQLTGEAFFKVTKNGKRFTVLTEYGEVEVKGTSFDVNAYAGEDLFETTLVEGSVAFKVKGSDNEVSLKPGEQIVKTPDGFVIKKVDTKYFTSWKDGKLLFYREPFPSFIKKLERWYNVKIEYSDPKLDKLWYTGKIEMEGISEVMEMISKSTSISYHYNKKMRTFTIKAR